jgi:hypothetical protein
VLLELHPLLLAPYFSTVAPYEHGQGYREDCYQNDVRRHYFSFLVETFFFLIPNIATALVLELVAVVAVRVFLRLKVTIWRRYVLGHLLAPFVALTVASHLDIEDDPIGARAAFTLAFLTPMGLAVARDSHQPRTLSSISFALSSTSIGMPPSR